MGSPEKIHIGLLSPAAANQPHYDSFRRMLPPGVSFAHEGLGLLGDSYRDLADQSAAIIARAVDFVHRHQVRGLILAGGFVTLFNPGLEAKVAAAIGLPVASAMSSAIAALEAFSAQSVLLMTPFDAASDEIIKTHLNACGLAVYLGPPFENRKAGTTLNLSPEALFRLVNETLAKNPAAQAIYFQGATMDPLPIIQRLEDKLGLPVIASNPAMLWNLISLLGLKYSIEGYGKLLSSWPARS